MNACKANSPEYQRQVIDAEIRSLEESIRELKCRRNELVPISSLPTEIVTVIFSYWRLPSSSPAVSSLPTQAIADLFPSSLLPGAPPIGRSPDHPLSWLHAAHVCHRWREIALNHHLFWNHVDFTNLTLAGAAETLARAKSAPLYLEARIPMDHWDDARVNAFKKVLQTRVSQICHLSINAEPFCLQSVLEGLTSPALTLEHLSLSQPDDPFEGLPHTLFGGATPRLSSLKLHNLDISWDSPFLKGLRYLEIRTPFASVWSNVPQWLNALGEMSQLEKLVLHSPGLMANPLQSTSDIQWSVSLPFLTHIDISAAAGNCALALSYLSLPALTRLRVTLASHSPNGRDIPEMFPSLSPHAHGPQDTTPLRSVLISGERTGRATILAWSAPDFDIDAHDPLTLLSVVLSARVALSITGGSFLQSRYCLLNRAMVALPLESIVTLTAQHHSRLDEHFWLRYAPAWPLLQCVRLATPEACGFIEMLLQDDNGCENPLLPSLTKFVLIDVAFSARRTHRLCDVLMKRVEQGVPLETLDLCTCHATRFAVRLLSEIVVDVWGPVEAFETKGMSRVEWDTTGESFVSEEDYPDASDSNSSDGHMAWEEAEVNFEDEEGEDNSDMEDD
ncbi:hypothetical protein V8E53_004523 [Lactarius tabidus]